jgi:hypothetical protein
MARRCQAQATRATPSGPRTTAASCWTRSSGGAKASRPGRARCVGCAPAGAGRQRSGRPAAGRSLSAPPPEQRGDRAGPAPERTRAGRARRLAGAGRSGRPPGRLPRSPRRHRRSSCASAARAPAPATAPASNSRYRPAPDPPQPRPPNSPYRRCADTPRVDHCRTSRPTPADATTAVRDAQATPGPAARPPARSR